MPMSGSALLRAFVHRFNSCPMHRLKTIMAFPFLFSLHCKFFPASAGISNCLSGNNWLFRNVTFCSVDSSLSGLTRSVQKVRMTEVTESDNDSDSESDRVTHGMGCP
jgi:hypothetical protein